MRQPSFASAARPCSAVWTTVLSCSTFAPCRRRTTTDWHGPSATSSSNPDLLAAMTAAPSSAPREHRPLQVVATAGHVDHGKSALILRLTGIDPDRLAEEKRRGLTIDLGFAWTTLPSGQEIGFVDVPRSEEHTSELQSRGHLVCRLLLEKKKKKKNK